MVEVSIRPYESGDPVAEVHERALRDSGGYVDPDDLPAGVDPDADLRDVEAHYLDGDGAFLVAEVVADEGEAATKVIGTAALSWLNGSVAEVTRMRVLPEFQGEGIGRRLLHEIEAVGRNRGTSEFVLDTAPHLEAAQALYESEGYEQVGYVETPFVDLIVYRKRVGNSTTEN